MFHEILLLISFEYLKIMRLVNIISECNLAMFNTHFVDRPGPSHKLCFEMLKEKFPKYHLKWQVRLIPRKKPSLTIKAQILLVIICEDSQIN